MTAIPGTLDFYLQAPYFRPVNLSRVPFKGLASKLAVAIKDDTQVRADTDALHFYCLNHLTGLIRRKFTPFEQLPEWADQVLLAYSSEVAQQAKRMLYYLIIINARESRHVIGLKEADDPFSILPFVQEVELLFGKEVKDFTSCVVGTNADVVVSQLIAGKPGVTLGVLCDYLTFAFSKGKGKAKQYAGDKWYKIARVLAACVRGETSMETMIDTAYTLQHNTSAIFNKDVIYLDHFPNIKQLLDVQRAGQIPEAVQGGLWSSAGGFTYESLKMLVKEARKHLDGIGEEVDWVRVKQAGALGNYDHLIAQQEAKKTPPKPMFTKEEYNADLKKLEEELADFAVDKKVITLLPGVQIETFEREAA